MNRKILGLLRIIVICICLGVIAYEGYRIYTDQKEYTVADNEYSAITKRATSISVDNGSMQGNALLNNDEAEVVSYPLLQVNHQELTSINEDYVAWLYFPCVGISYPVVKETEIDEYLYKTFEGKSNKAGCIFEDVLSSETFTGMHDIIFGHNMKNGSMFGQLKQLYKKNNQSLIDSNPYIYIYTKDNIFQYRVFAYYQTTVGSNAYSVVQGEQQYDDFIKYIKPATIYKIPEDIDFTQRPSVLTLSTCSGESGSGRRFVVHSVKTASWEVSE